MANNPVTQVQIDQWRELNQKIKSWEITAEQATAQMQQNLAPSNLQFDPAQLKNANENVTQYWDDSSSQVYNNPELWWWLNDKYKGAETKGTFTAYNPNATLEWLDPNYRYGQEAQMMNSQQANYIANRNDQIASALYNAWKVSLEDVAEFLNTQPWFLNSTNEERNNTAYSIWKRIWEIQPGEQQWETAKLEMNLPQWQPWEIYWRELGIDSNRGDFAFGEETLVDPYAVEAKMYVSRQNNFKGLQNLDSYDAAVLITSWTTPYGEQAMKDLQDYDPAKYKEIQEYIKEIMAWETINALSHWSATVWTSVVDTTDEIIKNNKADWLDKNTDIRSKDETEYLLDQKMDLNQTALTAKQQMIQYKEQIVDLQYELEDLPNKAKEAFKGDVPDYFYKAYISNNQQEIQNKMDKLESKYNAMADIYKTELANTQWEMEMQLKYQQLALQQNQNAFDQWYKASQLEQNSIQWSTDKKWNMHAYKIVNWYMVEITDWEAYQNYTNIVDRTVNQANYQADADRNSDENIGWECEAFTDKLTQKTAWVTMVSLSSDSAATTAAEKAWYATQFDKFSDYIPEVWDVAVFTNNGKNWVNEKRWHTMYVTDYNSKTGIVTLVWSNYMWDKRVYRSTYNLNDFYNHWWQWFWNPYKYAQRANLLQSDNTWLDPMEPVVDELLANGWLNVTQTETLSRFRNSYHKLYEAKTEGYIDSLLKNWVMWWFLRDVNIDFATLEKTAKKNGETVLDALVRNISSAAAKNIGDQDAYSAFMAILGVIETKLREESWAKINQWEWRQEFLQYLPEASDNEEMKKRKLRSLDNYLRWYAKKWGITWDQYIPLFDDLRTRNTD